MAAGRQKQAWFQDKLTEAVMTLCRQGNMYVTRAKVEGTICVVCDDSDVIVAHITESFFGNLGSGNGHSRHYEPGNMNSGSNIGGLEEICTETSPVNSSNSRCFRNSSSENLASVGAGSDHSPRRSTDEQLVSERLKCEDKQNGSYPKSSGEDPRQRILMGRSYEQNNYQQVKAGPKPRKASRDSPADPFTPSSLSKTSHQYSLHTPQSHHQSSTRREHEVVDPIHKQHLALPHGRLSISERNVHNVSAGRIHGSIRGDAMKQLAPQSDGLAGLGYVTSFPNDSQLATVYNNLSGGWGRAGSIGTTGINDNYSFPTIRSVSQSSTHTPMPAQGHQPVIAPYFDLDNFYCLKEGPRPDDSNKVTPQGSTNTSGSSQGHKCPYCERTYATSSKLWKHIRNENCSCKAIEPTEVATNGPVSIMGDFNDRMTTLDHSQHIGSTRDREDRVISGNDSKKNPIKTLNVPRFQQLAASPNENVRRMPMEERNSKQKATVFNADQSQVLEVNIKIESCESEPHCVESQEYKGLDGLLVKDRQESENWNKPTRYEDNNNNEIINTSFGNVDGNANCMPKENQAAGVNLRDFHRDQFKGRTTNLSKSKFMFRPSTSRAFKRLWQHPKKRFSHLNKGHHKIMLARSRLQSTGH